ncbi:MAG: hypothetical protein AABX13_02320 [Nanoarchaeota archaeon]
MTLKLHEDWAEVLAVALAVIGLIFSVALRSALFTYLTALLAGFQAGRILYLKHLKEPIFPFVLIIIGFLMGYLLGSFWANRVLIVMLFTALFWLSYKLHQKRIITTFKSELFIK